MATFTNQATLIYNGQSTSSNVTTGEILNGLTLTKTAIARDYGKGERIAYIVTIENSGAAITDATLTDDLGAYTGGDVTVAPLGYVTGSVLYYQNGTLATGVTAAGGPPLVITGIDVPAGGNAQLIYEAATNEFTPFETGSEITNTASVSGGGLVDTLTDTATVPVRDEVSLTIAKAVCPPVVNDNGTLTYTFIIQNSGNTPVVSTDNVVVTDTFNPILNPITVTFNGTEWTQGTDYSYDTVTGVFSSAQGSITVPAASYTQDAVSGVYSSTPGVSVITVTGTV